MKYDILETKERVLADNDKAAEELRAFLKDRRYRCRPCWTFSCILFKNEGLSRNHLRKGRKARRKRCLKCGATTVDTNRCIGCGLCTTRCEFDAIKITRDIPNGSKMYTAENGKLKAILPNMAKRGVKILINRKHK